jgi:large subunit ribosomal protein L23
MALDIYSVIKKPFISDKSVRFNQFENPKIVVEVDIKANKCMIKQAIRQLFGVSFNDITVHTIIVKGRTKRTKKGYYSEKDSKKAIVSFKKGSMQNLEKFASHDGAGSAELAVSEQ